MGTLCVGFSVLPTDDVGVEVEVKVSNNGLIGGTDNGALGRALLLILSDYHT